MPEATVAQLRAALEDVQAALETERAERAKEARKTAAIQEKLTEMTRRHHQDVLANTFGRVAHSMGIPAEAVPDVLNGLPDAGWKVNDKGEPELHGKDGAVFYDVSPEGWMRDQLNPGGRWAYLTRQGLTGGGGASGQDMSPGGWNPWSKEGWDDMEQTRVYRADPVKAEQLAKAAGSRIGALKPE